MTIKIGDKVEIKDSGARLFVQYINDNGYHLSISPEPGFVCVCIKQENEICKVGTTRYTWIDPVEGFFSSSWKTDDFITRDYMNDLLEKHNWGM